MPSGEELHFTFDSKNHLTCIIQYEDNKETRYNIDPDNSNRTIVTTSIFTDNQWVSEKSKIINMDINKLANSFADNVIVDKLKIIQEHDVGETTYQEFNKNNMQKGLGELKKDLNLSNTIKDGINAVLESEGNFPNLSYVKDIDLTMVVKK